jgi:hypothetical protein
VTVTASEFTVNNGTPQDIANLNSALLYLQASPLASATLQQFVRQKILEDLCSRRVCS